MRACLCLFDSRVLEVVYIFTSVQRKFPCHYITEHLFVIHSDVPVISQLLPGELNK